jgi:hypothetical protein
MILRTRTVAARLLSLTCIALATAAAAIGQLPSQVPSKGYLLITVGATEARGYQRFGGPDPSVFALCANGSYTHEKLHKYQSTPIDHCTVRL